MFLWHYWHQAYLKMEFLRFAELSFSSTSLFELLCVNAGIGVMVSQSSSCGTVGALATFTCIVTFLRCHCWWVVGLYQFSQSCTLPCFLTSWWEISALSPQIELLDTIWSNCVCRSLIAIAAVHAMLPSFCIHSVCTYGTVPHSKLHYRFIKAPSKLYIVSWYSSNGSSSYLLMNSVADQWPTLSTS